MTVTGYLLLGLVALALFCIDLFLSKTTLSLRNAILWSLFWVLLALAFAVGLVHIWPWISGDAELSGKQASLAFITAYLLEKSLSVDNLFVFAIIFQQYSVPSKIRPRVLLYGIIGALVLRTVLIFIGTDMIHRMHWIMYLFAALLIYSGLSLVFAKEEEDDISPAPERWLRRYFSVTKRYHGDHLFLRRGGSWLATPVAVVVAVIAFMDVMFALDSIPAIFAVTQHPDLILSANLFALLGLRSLFFVLQGLLTKFTYLKPALSIILVFIGIKMVLGGTAWEISTAASLGVILLTMTLAIVASVFKASRNRVTNL
ncbi:TerC/Alx family metal homeostasis membrane protein [Vibrio porteresiae]|uniref:TerC/Alx family metal homeostasis membrane protein n=1 Tax=Vibrio porteresiae DSM 19223 TaxID=1123496 RepID=A0ABZ0QJM5_9VIBR|nr:TerC/Alx family metal homeostasis membrane protein [Vibrio porteresiae]WPC76005.1 TerC/Alx family metal homeostasis membrane protein [Vibrio porteresiae DSM 19223]